MNGQTFNVIATVIFALAVLHTFITARFTTLAHDIQGRRDEAMRREQRVPSPSILVELLHCLGEVEVVFALWALPLLAAMTVVLGWGEARRYVGEAVNYTEPLFVVVIMSLTATRPIVMMADSALRWLAMAGGGAPAAWWAAILIVGPLLSSIVTEPAAMTICALLLARHVFSRSPSTRLKYATLGTLFVNVSIGGTLTHFAAPPVLMVARPWAWDTAFMFWHIGWRAALAIVASTFVYALILRRDLRALVSRPPRPEEEEPDADAESRSPRPVPLWITLVHVGFVAWTVVNAHYPPLFVGGFLFFLGFARATSAYQSRVELRTPLLVGLFLAGLVIHGGLQGWWIVPLLARLHAESLFACAAVLTAFNDNALITYLATLVPNLEPQLKLAVVQGAVVGGGLTVIANAPNPAGQALLARFFGGAISPVGLFLGAIGPTLIAALLFRVFT